MPKGIIVDPIRREERKREMSIKYSGSGNPNYGKKLSPESLVKHKEGIKKYWDDPINRLLQSERRKKFFTDHPEERGLFSKRLKGKHPSKNTREKMRDAHSGIKNHFYGKQHSEETKQKLRERANGKNKGENNPHYGKHHDDIMRKKLSDITKKRCENPEYIKKMSNAHKGFVNSEESNRKRSLSLRGEKCYLWKGGVSYLPYCFKFNELRKKAVRDFFKVCICCGDLDYKQSLSVHHIDHDKEQGCNGKPFNLVPFCRICHSKEVHNSKQYREYINKTLDDGFKWGIWSEEEYKIKVMYDE
jgi:hypothetical protein